MGTNKTVKTIRVHLIAFLLPGYALVSESHNI